ncbi:C2H2-type domain-containing protein [Pleurotus pulmonarius]
MSTLAFTSSQRWALKPDFPGDVNPLVGPYLSERDLPLLAAQLEFHGYAPTSSTAHSTVSSTPTRNDSRAIFSDWPTSPMTTPTTNTGALRGVLPLLSRAPTWVEDGHWVFRFLDPCPKRSNVSPTGATPSPAGPATEIALFGESPFALSNSPAKSSLVNRARRLKLRRDSPRYNALTRPHKDSGSQRKRRVPYHCPHENCFHQTSSQSAMSLHLKSEIHNGTTYTCPRCGIMFMMATSLKMHAKMCNTPTRT